jgi:hypothetical protein
MAQETSEGKSGLAISGSKNPCGRLVGDFSLETVTRCGSQIAPGLSATLPLPDYGRFARNASTEVAVKKSVF